MYFYVFVRDAQAQPSENINQEAMNSTIDATNAMEGDDATVVPLWVWFGLSTIAVVSFWCQATVTEER
jgi:hypothetical protein